MDLWKTLNINSFNFYLLDKFAHNKIYNSQLLTLLVQQFSKINLNFNYRRYEDEADNSWGCASWFEYLIVVVLSTILLIGALVLTLFWVIYYRGGFAWSENPEIQFNLHPVLMVGGFITLSGFCKSQFLHSVDRDQIIHYI